MSYTNGLDKPTDYFNTKLYTGDGTSSRNITGVGFQPDWVWFKQRSGTQPHTSIDSVRTGDSKLRINDTSAEFTGQFYNFNSDGFGWTAQDDESNQNGETYASWNWLASNTTASNTDGSITSTVSVNTTSGFSIVSYTGTGSNATVGHGLGVAPSMIIVKNRSIVENWEVYHQTLGNGTAIRLNLDDASFSTSGRWNNTSPTNSVFSLGTANVINGSGNNLIAYCFAEKKGYSKFGSYTGNGSTDGTFVYTGFLPSFVMTKRTTDGNESWHIFDNKRNTFNEVNTRLQANSSGNEDTAAPLGDFVSNGFKIRGTGGGINVSGKNFIYMAFAENPFVTSTGIPSCAR